jgi:hypothetical protein
MSIDNGTQTFDPMTEELELHAQIGAGYDVTFTLHTANASSQNNTLAGSTWYRSTAFGFGNGACVDDAEPDKDIPVTVHVEVMPGVPDGYTQNGVEWGAWPDSSQVRYNVVWHNATDPEPPIEEQPEDPPQSDNQTDIGQPPAENDDVPEDESDDNDAEDSEGSAPTGTMYSPFIFKGEPASVSITEDEISEMLPPAADSLYINGTLASYHYVAGQLHILSGNWSLSMNDTAVYAFDADFTMVQSDGLERKTYSLANLTAAEPELFDDGSIALTSALGFANDTATRANATITLTRLEVIQVQLESLDTPIYGVVDKILRTENGETRVMARHFDMI